MATDTNPERGFDPSEQDARDPHWMLGEPTRRRLPENALAEARSGTFSVRSVALWIAIGILALAAWALRPGCAESGAGATPTPGAE